MTESLLEPTEWVAHVCVSSGLAHLDRPFDYLLAPDEVDRIRPGVRVRVRLAGRLCDGVVLAVDHDHEPGVKLARIERVVSTQPVATSAQIALARRVADHWAGTLEEVLRWAIPTRHAATEAADPPPWPTPVPRVPAGCGLDALDSGHAFLSRVRAGGRPRAHWRVPPVAGPADTDRLGDWRLGIVQAVAAALASGRTALCCLPTVEEVDHLTESLVEHLGAGTVAVLHADQSTATRWRHYLAVIRGQARIVVGTRSAVMAPLADPGLVVVWDEGSDVHDEPRAPYPHTRDVAALRAQTERAALLLVDVACSTRAAGWLESGWLVGIEAPREALRRLCAPVRAPGDSDLALERDPLAGRVRVPDLAMAAMREGLASGPVLVQVARTGDLQRPTCATCRAPIECPHCGGTVQGRRTESGTELTCQWCGRSLDPWRCRSCGGTTVRSGIVGASTTASELGRAFPGVTVIDSSADHVRETIGEDPCLVVATPGAEPRPTSGYAAAVILDATAALTRPGLAAVEQTLDRWFHVLAMVRGATDGGRVVVVGPPGDRAVQALIRNDPVGWARRELADRAAARFPPAVAAGLVDGSPEAVTTAAQRLGEEAGPQGSAPIEGLEVLGPAPLPGRHGGAERSRVIVRAPGAQASRLAEALAHLRAAHTLHRETGTLRVRIDPADDL